MASSLSAPTSWALIGAATGLRSTVGFAAVLTGSDGSELPSPLGNERSRWAAWLLSAGELVVDKMPSAGARTSPPGLIPRLLLGGGSAALLARRTRSNIPLAAMVGSAAALGTAFAGLAGRNYLAARAKPVPAALIEDALAVAIATGALRLANRSAENRIPA